MTIIKVQLVAGIIFGFPVYIYIKHFIAIYLPPELSQRSMQTVHFYELSCGRAVNHPWTRQDK